MLTAFLLFVVLFGVGLSRQWPSLTMIEIGVITAILFVLLLWRATEAGSSAVRKTPRSDSDALSSSLALTIARWTRTNSFFIWLYRTVFIKTVPIAFALMLVLASAYLVNRGLFDAVNASGQNCVGTELTATVRQSSSKAGFRTDQICWASGLILEAGRRYRITLSTPGNWFDRTIRTDVNGFQTDSVIHFVAAPLKRWWGQNWFKPIARIGTLGNDEYILEPVDKFDDYTYCTHPERYGNDSSESRATANLEQSRLLEDELARSRRACLLCSRKKPESDSIGGKIEKASADALLDCSPTPAERKTLVAYITPRATGELFLYVNDAVLAIPGQSSFFYDNNTGEGSIEVARLRNAN